VYKVANSIGNLLGKAFFLALLISIFAYVVDILLENLWIKEFERFNLGEVGVKISTRCR
jgi:hypothetical protein